MAHVWAEKKKGNTIKNGSKDPIKVKVGATIQNHREQETQLHSHKKEIRAEKIAVVKHSLTSTSGRNTLAQSFEASPQSPIGALFRPFESYAATSYCLTSLDHRTEPILSQEETMSFDIKRARTYPKTAQIRAQGCIAIKIAILGLFWYM